ncbi:hypothetical protein [Mycobacterium xenopi]|uniref:Uncharacterized protein n=1 Tax=Mycobacterium xenopi TaxID=1789 RepID=A0AAD1H0V8_MYCXE|nr:hypothetical protein MXEN_00365 [Mycobacterium xenopi RIVM700367]BBU22370.1 hypothetical protein MYXE_21600 [Mycobacterium xenopi]SPX78247.1 Uncharacterised protein [Mycobacterium xenopi]
MVATPRDHPASATAGDTVSTLVVAGERTVRLVARGGSNTDRLLSRVAAGIGAAVDAVEAFWGKQWTREITVVATGSQREFVAAAGAGTGSQWADIAAVTVADRVDPDHRVAVGQRIVFAPGAAAMSDAALRIVLRHELFHYAARADTALDAPRWLTEGVADFVARPPTSAAGAAALATTLPSDADLDAPGPQRSLAYDRAWWFTRFVADAYGAATLRRLYVAAGGAGHVDAVAAMRTVLRGDPADLLARWQRWLTG